MRLNRLIATSLRREVDIEALRKIMEDYSGTEVYLTPYTDEYPYTSEYPYDGEKPEVETGTGKTYDNYLLALTEYINFD